MKERPRMAGLLTSMRSRVCAALAFCLWAASGGPPAARAQADGRETPGARELALHPRPARRCRQLRLARLPASYSAFEDRILAWMASCVTSETGESHREVVLVRGNASLARLWKLLRPGARDVRIVPRYTWGTFRVERIAFSSPDAMSSEPARAGPRTPAGPASSRAADSAEAAEPRVRRRPPGSAGGGVLPPLPDDPNDLLGDAETLVEALRARRRFEDAKKLEALVRKARTVATSVVVLVGAYYIGVKFRAGKLLFLWGLRAAGPRYQRALARLGRLLPEAETALGDIVKLAEKHPEVVGSDIEWKVLDRIVDPAIPAQIDDAACGPACVHIILRDRGIEISQEELVRRARKSLHPELKQRRVTPRTIARLLRELDPRGGWVADPELDDEYLSGKGARQILEDVSRRGPWIAQVRDHMVVVDGFDNQGLLRIRDPWYEPGRQRGIRTGSHYRVTLRTFIEHWHAIAIRRK